MIIASDEELFDALNYSYHYSCMLSNIISSKTAEKLNSINEQLEDLGIIDDEGVFKNTVLGKRAQGFEMTKTEIIIDLNDNDQIKTEMDKYSPVITVHTVEAFYEDMNKLSFGIKYDIEEMIEKTRTKKQSLVWSMRHAGVLTANYKGKAEAMQKKADAYKNAILIKDGATVRVNGRLYKAKYTRPNVSDPVHFDEIN